MSDASKVEGTRKTLKDRHLAEKNDDRKSRLEYIWLAVKRMLL